VNPAAAADVPLRPLRADDQAIVVTQREAMFREAARHPAAAITAMSAAFGPWLAPRLADGRYFGWLAEHAGAVVGGLGMMWLDWPPHPLHAEPGRGYLLNLWVDPSWRRRGVARRLVECGIAHARAHGVAAIVLHPTAQAEPLYRALGFHDSRELLHLLPRPD
jgi:ribosomal protein S18 acetylase RimI-like enzyme